MAKTMLTRAGADKLRGQLQQLRTRDRPLAIEALQETRDSSDFQQSPAYSEAVEKQQRVERLIVDLENKLANAVIVDLTAESGDKQVGFGALVTLRNERTDDESACYRIVGEDEADIPSGKLSVSAPLARALIGHEQGDVVTVETPGGTQMYRILEIRYGR